MSDNGDGPDRRKEFQRRQRARLLYSLRDFQIARSAAAFLAECEPEEKYSLIEMRRFRCHETTMIVAYARPFLESQGKIPKLSIKMANAKLNDEKTGLHRRLLTVRNKAIFHSDTDMMCMLSQAETITLNDDCELVFFRTVFDEGLEFIGHTLHQIRGLIEVVYSSIFRKLFANAPRQPENFQLQIEHVSKASS